MGREPERRSDEPRPFCHGVADGADNGHHHRAAHAAADQILDDAANIQSACRGSGIGSRRSAEHGH
jgi:hypothetical protein